MFSHVSAGKVMFSQVSDLFVHRGEGGWQGCGVWSGDVTRGDVCYWGV